MDYFDELEMECKTEYFLGSFINEKFIEEIFNSEINFHEVLYNNYNKCKISIAKNYAKSEMEIITILRDLKFKLLGGKKNDKKN